MPEIILRQEKLIGRAILLFVLVVQAVAFAPELATARYRNNDSVLHFAMIQGIAGAAEHGENPLDFWSAETSIGMPMARTYQPLSHLIVVAAYYVTGKSISLLTLFEWARYLTMILMPAAFYFAMTRFDFPPFTAAATALLVPLIAGPGSGGSLGVDLRSWMFFGLYPQAVGTLLLVMATGMCYRALRTGKHLVPAGAMVGLTVLAHFIYGWMAALTVCLMALLPDREAPRRVRIRRTGMIAVAAAAIAAFQLSPLFTDGYLVNRSRLEPDEKYDSYGAGKVLEWLLSGQLMDYGRVPTLSLLALFGVGMILWHFRKTRKISPAELTLLSAAAFWILVFFGRPTWGGLLTFLGATADLHLHRVIGAAQIFLCMIAGVGLAMLWREAAHRWHFAAPIGLTLLLLAPMVMERAAWLDQHTKQGQEIAATAIKDGATLDTAISVAKQRGGRVYAGLPSSALQLTLGGTPVYAYLMASMTPSLNGTYILSSLPSDLIPRLEPWKPQTYRLFNIRSVLSPKVDAPDFLKLIGDYGNYRVLSAPGEGYFGLVDVAAAAATTRETFYDFADPWLHSNWPEKDRYILLDFRGEAPNGLARVTPAFLPDSPPAGPSGTVSNERQTRQVYEADFDVPRPMWALFRMTFHPAWNVLVDGRPAKTAMLTPGFLGAPIEPGHHHVVARYEPGNGKLLLAFAGVALVLLLAAIEWRVGFKFAA